MKILAYVQENRFWLDVLATLEAKGHAVACIVGSPAGLGSFHTEVHRRFPRAVYYDHYAANRSEYGAVDFDDHALEFDSAARDVWELDSQRVMDMMSRQDARDDFSYRDRRDLFYSHLRFADYLMSRHGIDAALTSVQPHDPFLYVVACLLRRRGRPIATMTATNFDCRYFPAGPEGLAELRATYEKILAEHRTEPRLPEPLKNELVRLRGRTQPGRSADTLFTMEWLTGMYRRGIGYDVRNLLKLALLDLRDALKSDRGKLVPFPTRFEKEPHRPIDKSFRGLFARLRHEVYFFNNRRLIRKLQSSYRRFISLPPLDRPFVFVPLHYQPEMSTNPLGGAFSFQVLLLETLSASLPEGWHIVVKEHPSQHNPLFQLGTQGRRPHDYELFARIPKMSLVPTSTNQFDLIDASQAVATITGTAGWEALVRGKPVLVFGDAWYKACRGAFVVGDVGECRRALAAIAAGASLVPLEAELFAEAIEQFGLPPFIGSDGDWGPWVIAGAGDERRDEMVRRYAAHFDSLLIVRHADRSIAAAVSECIPVEWKK